ncbi:amino acid ABC transporter substrate-binding protein [Oxalobacteraceae bacterium OM1]|nr:amino acid ABC transporter substrate-binding protein [Oxalobacteraceae bacterium OM1]
MRNLKSVGTAVAIGLTGLSCVAAGAANAADTLAKIRDTRTIVIAHRDSSVPFSYLDDNKKPVGYAVDLCLKVADAVKRELKLPQLNIEYLPVTSSNRIPAIAEGKADLECGSTTNNAERRKQVAFTIPHFVAAVRMVVRTDSGIKNWSDLRDKRVVTTKGTTTVKLLNERDKVRSLSLKLLEGRDHADSFAMVEKGQAEAFPMDDVLLFGLRANAPTPANFEIVGDTLSAEPYAIMLRKDDPAFKAIVDREMGRIINDGEIYKLYDKWFKSPIPPKQVNMNMPMGHLLRDMLRFPTDKVGD